MTATPRPNCTCPTGDGSLRWPCPQHPPAFLRGLLAQVAAYEAAINSAVRGLGELAGYADLAQGEGMKLDNAFVEKYCAGIAATLDAALGGT